MMIKSISKISSAGQLPEGWLMEESVETGDIKRKKGYISVEELETYLEEYLVKNLPRFFEVYQKEIVRRQNIMRSDEEYTGLGSNIQRKEVISICFRDKFPEDLSEFERYWDVSEKGDKSVMAYAERFGSSYAIFICGDGTS